VRRQKNSNIQNDAYAAAFGNVAEQFGDQHHLKKGAVSDELRHDPLDE